MHEYSLKCKLYMIFVIFLAYSATLYGTLSIKLDQKTFLGIVFFIIISILSESIAISLPKGGYISVTFAIDYAVLLTFGAPIASWIIIIGTLLNRKHGLGKRPVHKILFNSAQAALSIMAASIMVTWKPGSLDINNTVFFSLITIALIYFVVNAATVAVALSLINNVSPWHIWFSNMRWAIPNLLALAPVGILMVYGYKHYYIIGVAVLFVPLLVARYSFKLYLEMRGVLADTLHALVNAIEAKDRYTRGHSERVARYATAIARQMKLDEQEIERLQLMALLHDVGKVAISNKILNKKGYLSRDEFQRIIEHSTIGANIVREIQYFGDAYKYIKYHHEKYNGGGYPEGIMGDRIPLGARIIAVADAFDAMTSNRPYREGIPWEEAIKELRKFSGKQHDPRVVEALFKACEAGLDNVTYGQNVILEAAAANEG